MTVLLFLTLNWGQTLLIYRWPDMFIYKLHWISTNNLSYNALEELTNSVFEKCELLVHVYM